MGFDLRQQLELVQIVANGGSIRMKGDLRPIADLVQIVANASKSGAKVCLYDMSLRPQADLVQLAAIGKGCVTFEG